jgi:hypothetical protein
VVLREGTRPSIAAGEGRNRRKRTSGHAVRRREFVVYVLALTGQFDVGIDDDSIDPRPAAAKRSMTGCKASTINAAVSRC